ncbi:hypothetical protein HN51_067929 [Arachis hypogaea]|uniref:pentatricopeptide repeat-containing protein At2g31400, chloroplastic n=1 Tax=Arachis ipaensis TaxID=130454 RepID=UPI0007AF11F6|nr:pentatricopeptide repeat-containing protein At2g31400, chloroplastic [Arachis ipaensis]XP_016194467.1 pentatricopeptide repeat-containing protein At2g31400, chloroplastic [Arachis ipaensis]XP_025650142.1 pentatricopeptide repeat-containing protein At2g31400, chloroplastic [Arachis hypogaea]
MASAPPTPPPHCSSVPSRPNATSNRSTHNHRHSSHHNNHNRHNHQNSRLRRQEQSRWNHNGYGSFANNSPLPYANATGSGSGAGVASASAVAAAVAAAAAGDNAPAAFSSALGMLGGRRSTLGLEFSGRRTTRFAARMRSGRLRYNNNKTKHSLIAEEVQQCLEKSGNDVASVDNVLLSYESKMYDPEDYIYLIRECGNKDLYLQVSKTYDFAMGRKHYNWFYKGKLTSTVISQLGKMKKIEHACRVFDVARSQGFGNTVYSYSSMINAYGHNGRFNDAVRLYRSMRPLGMEPNLITYNALIDAGAKGHVDFSIVAKFVDEMVANGIMPDRITYNSLLSVCVPGGAWEIARDLFAEMRNKGHEQDVYTYNTYLDVLCKGGQLDFARRIFADMSANNVFPNAVTYSILMDGYSKAGQSEEALALYDEMKRLDIPADKVSYNTLIAVYGRLGLFEDALFASEEMEICGYKKDIVTYNALLGGYGKHGMYDEVKRIFTEMKRKHIYPNTLTYSTLINVYTKGGMYMEAMEVYREFKENDLEVDVVFYSQLIDTLCKNGLVESAMVLLDVMTRNGITPNVVTYNSMIDAFGDVSALGFKTSFRANDDQTESSASMLIAASSQNQTGSDKEDRISKMFEQLAVEKAGHGKKDLRTKQDFSILWLLRKMHELEIKPNVVTFSAILNACSRCNSFEDASRLLDELRLFNDQVYGVAHGLLMGSRENTWLHAQAVFDDMKRMDNLTASAFYNALTDMLWNFGQKRGAQLVVLEGRNRNVWTGDWSIECLDLHLMSCGAACAMVHDWLLNIRSIVFEGSELPKLLSILTGWGKHSKVLGDGALKRKIEALLNGIGAPFKIAESNIGRFTSPGYLVAAWLKKSSTLNVLVLHDRITASEPTASGLVYSLQAP